MNAEELRGDPGLIDRVENAEYQMVFICPEFIDPRNNKFMKLAGIGRRVSKFAMRLGALVVDEAHLVYVWRLFRYIRSN